MRPIYMHHLEERGPGGCRHRHGHHGRHGGPPYGPWGRGFRPGGGRKAGRGDIRAAILTLLAEGPMHGYQIIGEISERSEGAWRPSPGSVYPTLQQLADEGLVTSSESEGRRVHTLTDAGREQASAQEGSAPWTSAASEADDPHLALRELGFGVIAAARQVAQTGSEAQLTAAAEVLRDARRRLYRLLADEE